MVVVAVIPPPVPVSVTGYCPATAEFEAVKVIVEVAVPVRGFALKAEVTPAGNPLSDKVTGDAKPPETVLVTEELLLLPVHT